MIEIREQKSKRYKIYFVLTDAEYKTTIYIDKKNTVRTTAKNEYKELLLRTVINKIRNISEFEVFATDEWNVPLEEFGFVKEDDMYIANSKDLVLPRGCVKN